MKRLFSLLLLFFYIGMSTFIVGCSSKKTHTPHTNKKATMRPYKVRGKRYYPAYVKVGETQKGISSWYGPHFNGKKTSNGEIYNMYANTAAHKTWPMGTMVKVTNLQNKKSTIVRINDRGPFVKGRIIDCSYRAGKSLGLDKMGVEKVSIEVVGINAKSTSSGRKKVSSHHHKSVTKNVRGSSLAIQVGAFHDYESAQSTKERYAKRYPRYTPVVKRLRLKGSTLYRVWLTGFSSQKEAEYFKAKYDLKGAFIVQG